MEIIMNISLNQSIHLAKAASTSNNIYALERALKAVEYYLCAITSNEYLNSKYSLVLSYFARKLESKLMGLNND
jgi:hypothetical protein